jgi:hypothetical protein
MQALIEGRKSGKGCVFNGTNYYYYYYTTTYGF